MNFPRPLVLGNLVQPFTYGPNNNAETVVFSRTIPAGHLQDQGGATSLAVMLGLDLQGLVTTVGGAPVLDLRWRIGPVTLTGQQIGLWRLFASNNMTDKTVALHAQATIQPDGVSIWGNGMMLTDATTGQWQTQGAGSTAAVAVDPTIDNLLEVTADWDDLAANIFKITNASFSMKQPPYA